MSSTGETRPKGATTRAVAPGQIGSNRQARRVLAAHSRNLASMRREVMWWLRELNKIPKNGVKAATIAKLLGRNQGIFDALNLGVQMALRLIDKEWQLYGLAGASLRLPPPNPHDSEDAIGQRINAELDRIAAYRAAQGNPGAARPGQ